MNRILFDTLTFLNGFIAIIAVAIASYVGWNIPLFSMARLVGLLIGAFTGLAFAAIFCGMMAYFALMERHMRTIAEGLSHGTSEPRGAPQCHSAAGRQEPRL